MMGLEAELKAMFAPEHWIVVEILLQLLAAYVGTVAFSILFSVPKKYHFDCGATGAIGWGVYLVISRTCDTPVIATFFSSMVLTMLARYQAVKCKAPTTVFLLSGIFTLVPDSLEKDTLVKRPCFRANTSVMMALSSTELATYTAGTPP